MGKVVRLATAGDEVALGEAARRFLLTLDHPESRNTHRAYGSTLRVMAASLGGDAEVAALTPGRLREWFAGQWGDARPATWQARRGALRSFLGYCEAQGWVASAGDLIRGIETRRIAEDRDKALSRAEIRALLTDDRIPLRERTLWRMLYETAARSAEVLRLDVEDLDQPNNCAPVRRKGGAIEEIVWQTPTAVLLSRLLKGRKRGPVFLTEKRSRVRLPPADLDPESGLARLSYERAEQLFKRHTGGATLHQLRHSALTHLAEEGVSTPMMKKISGHKSVRSLGIYTKVSNEALRAFRAGTDPGRRR